MKKRWLIPCIFVLAAPLCVPSASVIQVQESNQNELIVAELTQLTVKDNIITVKLKIRNNSEQNEKMNFYFKDLFLIDEQNQKKYYVLKDSEGKCIAGPFSGDAEGGRFEFWIESKKISNIWAKLPLPLDNPSTISLAVPGFLPFESIPLPNQG